MAQFTIKINNAKVPDIAADLQAVFHRAAGLTDQQYIQAAILQTFRQLRKQSKRVAAKEAATVDDNDITE